MRATPFYCPFCGEQTIEPIGDEKEMYCSSCDRRFEIAFKGLGEGGSGAEA